MKRILELNKRIMFNNLPTYYTWVEIENSTTHCLTLEERKIQLTLEAGNYFAQAFLYDSKIAEHRQLSDTGTI